VCAAPAAPPPASAPPRLLRAVPPSGRPAGPAVPLAIHGPVRDVALALAWVPFAAVVHGFQSGGPSPTLTTVVSAVFVLSFAHQPLTVGLVYGDPSNFALRRTLFTWTPLVMALAVAAVFSVSFTALAVIGALWNAEHTLMQRYGMTRIYGRKVGDADGRWDRALLWSWLVLAVVWIAGDPATPGRLGRVNVGRNNREAINVLLGLQPLGAALRWPVALAAAAIAVGWLVRERRRPVRNPYKSFYVGATAALFAVMLVDPLAGVMAYVGAHAVEYFVVVHHSLGRRYAESDGGAVLGRVVRARTGRAGFLAAYLVVVGLLVALLGWIGSPLAYTVVFFTLGGLHVFYDGFIWKLRRPAVARSLAVPV
jgi:hypothetical protein